jgi:hypothetical protein
MGSVGFETAAPLRATTLLEVTEREELPWEWVLLVDFVAVPWTTVQRLALSMVHTSLTSNA